MKYMETTAREPFLKMLLFSQARQVFASNPSCFVAGDRFPGGTGADFVTPEALNHAPAWVAGILALALAAVAFAPHPDTAPANLSQLTHQAMDGEPPAELQLALDYRDGRLGLTKNAGAADTWLARAAQAGNAEAAALLGDAYSTGDGVAQDGAAARRWWRQAADAGNAHAEAQLGIALMRSSDQLTAHYEGLQRVNQAAAQGDSSARQALGIDTAAGAQTAHRGWFAQLYRMLDTLTLSGQSIDSLKTRALNGDSVAQYQLAMRYRDGAWGVEADPGLALSWLRLAADHGNPVALSTLADAYAKGGFGLTADAGQAALWRLRAAACRAAAARS